MSQKEQSTEGVRAGYSHLPSRLRQFPFFQRDGKGRGEDAWQLLADNLACDLMSAHLNALKKGTTSGPLLAELT